MPPGVNSCSDRASGSRRESDAGAVVKPAALPEPLGAAAFSTASARAAGVPPQRLRRSDLIGLYRGVHSPAATLESAAAPTLLDRARAYSARMPDGHRFSHVTAAELNSLRMPENFTHEVLHVTATSGRAPESAGVTGHLSQRIVRLHPAPLRCSSAIDSWIECASLLSLDDLIVMGDGLVSRRNPLATLDELRAAVSSYGSGRGASRLRTALAWIRPGSDSAPETKLRLVVVRAGFAEPEVNGQIRNSSGALIAHGDLVLRAARVVLEYEGRQHAEDTRQFGIDIARLDDIMEERWRVIRVDRKLLNSRATLLGKIRRAVDRGTT